MYQCRLFSFSDQYESHPWNDYSKSISLRLVVKFDEPLILFCLINRLLQIIAHQVIVYFHAEHVLIPIAHLCNVLDQKALAIVYLFAWWSLYWVLDLILFSLCAEHSSRCDYLKLKARVENLQHLQGKFSSYSWIFHFPMMKWEVISIKWEFCEKSLGTVHAYWIFIFDHRNFLNIGHQSVGTKKREEEMDPVSLSGCFIFFFHLFLHSLVF